MKASGRFRVGAPTCANFGARTALLPVTDVDIASWTAGTTIATAITAAAIKNGDTTLSAAHVVGAVTVNVTSNVGFIATTGKAIVGYGLRNAEVITCGTLGSTTTLGTCTLINAHAKGERVVQVVAAVASINPAAIRPGSVVIRNICNSNLYSFYVDDGQGNIVLPAGGTEYDTDALFVGTVDYNTGTVSLVFNSDTHARTVTMVAETLNDHAGLEDIDGTGYFKNFVGMSLTRRDLPDVVIATNEFGATDTNLGALGFFLEVSKSNGYGFQYIPGSARQLAPGQRCAFIIPGGAGTDAVRIRCGTVVGSTSGTLEFDFATMTNQNGE